MTAIVGIFCKDGIVIGADSAATSAAAGGIRTIEQPVMKIDIIGGRIIIAGTGQIGLGQRFRAHVEDLWGNKKLSGADRFAWVRLIAGTVIKDFQETSVQHEQYGGLMAFPCKHEHHLVEFALRDFQPEFKDENIWYVSMGSGQLIVDPFLAFIRDVFWDGGPPTTQDAIFATTWALDHVIKVNPGGVNGPVRIATLTKINGDWTAQLLSDDDLLEHRANVEAAKDALRNYKVRMSEGTEAAEIPPAPDSSVPARH